MEGIALEDDILRNSTSILSSIQIIAITPQKVSHHRYQSSPPCTFNVWLSQPS
ncbi:hypothetical protein SCLCIDRAFT_1206539 [Scleroderma citrinum Foug A]|uniref:Uncharacterized protein n=1 Tax=Scleroderma citrinum Foug A TaxID=1036808 RepID=A0A0C3AZI1_9AGAM|nr:hypothetical protein SCLCIDRAFT_1214258 [Scleroderma citrinum Foug A]KIM63786.1 hypothetical protein SCLCIDRAFT_1213949 [Scleroderma citrinum Foug A]KIM70412.1 hypothetical protein SCLCIDRAFT_1206539 [Scleroderma citrinum Foug A]